MNKGFTLLEIIVGMAIAMVVIGGVLFLQFTLGGTQLEAFRNYINTNEADSTVTKFTREIRTAKQSDNGAYPLEILGDFEIVFYSDLDFDNSTERIRYTLNDSTLEKGVIDPANNPIEYPTENEVVTIISENVTNGSNPVFYYYNESWPQDVANNPLQSGSRLANTKSVGIMLNINSNPNISSNEYNTESTTAIRFLKNDY
jgi:hypothetical protein